MTRAGRPRLRTCSACSCWRRKTGTGRASGCRRCPALCPRRPLSPSTPAPPQDQTWQGCKPCTVLLSSSSLAVHAAGMTALLGNFDLTVLLGDFINGELAKVSLLVAQGQEEGDPVG